MAISVREGKKVRQQVIATLGRLDLLEASGQLERLMRSGLRHCESFAVLDNAVAVTPDNLYVVSGSYDKTLCVWDLMTGETKTTLHGHTGSISAVAVTPDGRHVVSGSDDKTLRVWDLATGETKTTLHGHTSSISAVAVTLNGRQAVSGSRDKRKSAVLGAPQYSGVFGKLRAMFARHGPLSGSRIT